MRRIRVTGPARRDIAQILRRSGAEFGDQARHRYRQLIDQALRDLGNDPQRTGVRTIDDVREGYVVYHLKSSRRVSAEPSVRHPRHLIAFFVHDSGTIIVARVFHERQLLARHLTEHDDR